MPNAPAPNAPSRSFDGEVLARFRRGDREAFLTIYDAHAGALRALVARFFGRPFEREEALQEVWLQVHRMANAYDPARGELLPWLRAVAANRCKELLRAQGRRPNAEPGLDEAALPELGAEDPERAARSARARGAVERFEQALPSEEARIFRLSLIEDRSHDEVARAIGISARRCKYLRMKLLLRAAANPELRRALAEVTS